LFAARTHIANGTSAAASLSLTLDVRARLQYDMAHLPCSICVPYQLLQQWDRAGTLVEKLSEVLLHALPSPNAQMSAGQRYSEKNVTVFVVCRRGINSVKAVRLIQRASGSAEGEGDGKGARAENPLQRFVFKSVEGGLNAYHVRADPNFPFY
jgi:adenylyltransferase and sulfurtransferase